MNTHEQINELLAGFALAELSEQQSSEVKKHLDDCQQCRSELKRLEAVLECAASMGELSADEQVCESAKQALLSAVADEQKKQPTPRSNIRLEFIWRTIMKNKTMKLAAAAVIIIAVLAGLPFLSRNGTGVALADVLEKVEQARAFMYKMEMTTTVSMMPEMPTRIREIQGTTIISTEYGMKAQMEITDPNTGETTTQQMYILPDQKVMLTLMPEQKKYQRMEFDDDRLARVKREKNDPREMLKRIMDCNYTELGRKEIDGIEVEGFETTDPKFSGGFAEGVKVTLWVDVETWLPVLWEIDMKMNEQMQVHGVLSDFQWDIPVVASDFEPVIPEDYTALATDGYKAPSLSEEVALGRDKSAATDHYDRGQAHYLNGEYDQAFSELTKAIEIDPGLARAYVIRGMAYNDKDKFDLSIADFTRVIEIKPTDAHAYVSRGMAYGNKGEYDLAVADHSKAIEIDPTLTDPYRLRARAYTYKGEYDKAWKDVYQAQALGRPVDSKLLEKLRKASGRDE